jgi:hypothetical protein
MWGPLGLNTTSLAWQRGGATQWTAGLDASSNWGVIDGAGGNRVSLDRGTGHATLTAMVAGAGTFSAVAATEATVGAADIASLTGDTATWANEVSAADYWIQNIGHWASEAQFPPFPW